MSGQLGCAQTYTAVVHWRGGGRVYTTPSIVALTGVTWGRTWNDISDAQAVVAKPSLTPDCCDALGAAEPWLHELTIYRDGDLVWQGPITRTTETRTSFVIDAQDVFAWLDKVVNDWRIQFTSRGPDADRRPGPVTKIAETIIRLNLTKSASAIPADWPGMMPYLVRSDAGLPTITFEKDGTANTSIWTAYVGDILRELTKQGLTWTTVGRTLLLRGKPTPSTLARARLTLEDITGDVQVIRDGASTATASWATNQQDQDLTGRTEVVRLAGTPYGRMDSLVHVEQDESVDTTAEIVAALQNAARSDLAGRYPTPIAISIPDGSQLSPMAPVQISELVCGERLDVLTGEFCTQIGQGFALSDVQVAWTDSGEQVGISLTPLADPYGNALPDPS